MGMDRTAQGGGGGVGNKGRCGMGRVVDTSESQLATRKPEPENNGLAPTVSAEVPISAIIAQAVENKTDPANLERLFALYERMEAKKAERSFADAMARFKAECPPIPRGTINTQFTKKKVSPNGGVIEVPRTYSALDDIEPVVRPHLGNNGLSYRWGEASIDDKGRLVVKCIVTHRDGHSISAASMVPIDSKAGCSDQQKYGAAMTYAQRYSLILALGLTTCDEDDDGNEPQSEKIDEHSLANMEAALDEVCSLYKADPKMRARFLEWLGVEKLADLPANRVKVAFDALADKKRKAAR